MKKLQVSFSDGFTSLIEVSAHETLHAAIERIEEETGSEVVSFSMGKGWN